MKQTQHMKAYPLCKILLISLMVLCVEILVVGVFLRRVLFSMNDKAKNNNSPSSPILGKGQSSSFSKMLICLLELTWVGWRPSGFGADSARTLFLFNFLSQKLTLALGEAAPVLRAQLKNILSSCLLLCHHLYIFLFFYSVQFLEIVSTSLSQVGFLQTRVKDLYLK